MDIKDYQNYINQCIQQSNFWRDKDRELEILFNLTELDRDEIIARYLKQLDNETNEKFNSRRKISIFRPFLQQQVNSFVDKIFQMPASIKTDDAWLLNKALNNFDGTGRNFAEFSKDFAKRAELVSQGYVFVDKSAATYDEFGNVDIAKESKTNVIILDPRNILHHRIVDGVLVYLRFKEIVTIQDGWADRAMLIVKEILLKGNEVYYNTYQQVKADNWVQVQKEVSIDIDHIPLVDVYPAGMLAPFTTEPVWKGLAHDNTDHLQYYSQYLNLSKTLSAPLLYGRNMGINNNVVRTGSGRILHSENYDSDLKYVEPTGNSLSGSKTTVDKIETDINNYPLNINKSNSGSETATKSIIQEGAIIAALSSHAQAYKNALEKIVKEVLHWENKQDVEFEIIVNTDFTIRADALQLQVYNDLKDRNAISDFSYVEGVKYSGYLPENFNTKKDMELIKKESEDKLPMTPPITPENEIKDFNENVEIEGSSNTDKQMDELFNSRQ